MGELAGAARRSGRALNDPAIPEPGGGPGRSGSGRLQAILWVASIALATPWLLTYNTAPSPTFLNQAAAWAGWGLALLLLASQPRPANALQPDLVAATWPLLMVAAVLAIAAASAPWSSSLPTSLGLSGVLTFAGAALVLLAGAAFSTADRLPDAGRVLFVPLLIGSLASVPIAAIQVFDPESAGNFLIAGASFAERASGNVRQPNHLSSLALWGLVALVWLHETHGKRHAPPIALGMVMLVATIVLTGSRTGVIGLLVLAAWGVIDRALSRRARTLLMVLPFVYALAWWLFRMWATRSLGSAEAIDRIAPGSDYSSARFAIWSDAIELIRQHPWLGVGYGEFNFVWTLTPLPGRPQQFYDHAHNLPLHWLTEMGIPIGLALIGAMLLGVWRALTAARDAVHAQRVVLRGAFVLSLLVGVHSLLEYPLWYSYFLLPTVFALGLCLGGGSRSVEYVAAYSRPEARMRLLASGAVLMLVASAWAVLDYQRVVSIFNSSPGTASLEERIAIGQRSALFSHHAHYAAATNGTDPPAAARSFRQAAHFLLDTRLMSSGASAYAALGDLERARYLADRLREFKLPASEAFFSDCTPAATKLPFQCRPAETALSPRDFR